MNNVISAYMYLFILIIVYICYPYFVISAYMYLDLSMDEDGTLPQLIRDKYTLGRTLGK